VIINVIIKREIGSKDLRSAKALNQAVKRNEQRFPRDFMFQLTWEEVSRLKSQFVTSNVISDKVSRSQFVTLKRGLLQRIGEIATGFMLLPAARGNRSSRIRLKTPPASNGMK